MNTPRVDSVPTYDEVRQLMIGIVPSRFREIDSWFDEQEQATCFLLGANLSARLIVVYELGLDDMYFTDEPVSYPIRLWLKK